MEINDLFILLASLVQQTHFCCLLSQVQGRAVKILPFQGWLEKIWGWLFLLKYAFWILFCYFIQISRV